MKTPKLIASVFFVLGLLFVAVNFLQDHQQDVTLSATEMPVPYPIDEFQLIAADGAPFTKSRLLGKYTVLYFGFTRCPDACPTALAHFRSEIPKLSEGAREKTQFLMVSVDPEHDKPALLKAYVEGFHQDIFAVTGENAELQKLAASMKTTFHKEEKTAGEPDLYMMAHSPRYFLVDPEARLRAVYNPPMEPGILARDLNRLAEKSAASGWLF